MSVDLTGGLPESREELFVTSPTTPGMRDASNMWLWDDSGEIGLPRVAIEAVAPNWDEHDARTTLATSDGRILREWGSALRHDNRNAAGKAAIIGARPIRFETIEPFRRYIASFDGSLYDTDFDAQARNRPTDKRATLSYEIECEMAVPPWAQGTMSEAAREMIYGSAVEGNFMGGDRLEQLFRARGRIAIDGKERDFRGGGLRIRRKGIRNSAGFWGHAWQSALFPSGKAFGYIAYPPRPDGAPSYNEGYVFTGDGPLIPATVVEAPWLTRIQHHGENVGLVLDTAKGRIRIEGETVISAPHYSEPGTFDAVPPLNQSIVRYRWDGEEALGMMERSNLEARVAAYG